MSNVRASFPRDTSLIRRGRQDGGCRDCVHGGWLVVDVDSWRFPHCSRALQCRPGKGGEPDGSVGTRFDKAMAMLYVSQQTCRSHVSSTKRQSLIVWCCTAFVRTFQAPSLCPGASRMPALLVQPSGHIQIQDRVPTQSARGRWLVASTSDTILFSFWRSML